MRPRARSRNRKYAFALALLLPQLAFGQATIANYQTPPLRTSGGTIAEQHDDMVLALQSLAALFQAKVAGGTEPNDVLQCVQLGLQGQTSTRKDWRVCAIAADAITFEQNTATDVSPTWVERLRITSAGITSAPAPHTHPAADVISGLFADARISQTSVEQWSVVTPTAARIPRADASAQLAAGWISQTGVTQYQNALSLSATQITSGQFADGRVALSNIQQYGYLPKSGDVILRFSGACPSGTTEYTPVRGKNVRGADTLAADGNVPDSPGTSCSGAGAGAGCGAAGGAPNYNDQIQTAEMPAHTHTGPSHSHTTTLSGHNHLGPSHQHTMAHTHSFSTPNHTHDVSLNEEDASGQPFSSITGDDNAGVATLDDALISSGGASGLTTGASSAANTGSSGTGATSTDGGGTFGSSTSGTGDTGSTGGTQPFLGPFVTALFCVVS